MQVFPRFVTGLLLVVSFTFASLVYASSLNVPEIDLTTDNGKLSLKALQGQAVYVDFWASWCAPCRKSFPWMNKMQAKYGKQGLRIIAVNVDSDQALAKKFLKEHRADFTIAYDSEGKVASAFGVKGMPNSFLVDSSGHIKSAHVGFREKDIQAMEADIVALLHK